MKSAIIGCGYVGSAVAQHWREAGLYVTATTTSTDRLPELVAIADRVEMVRGSDTAALQAVLSDCQVALLSIGAPNPQTYEETYLQTAKTLTQILSLLPTLEQLIYTSSYSIYGQGDGNWVDETTPVQPNSKHAGILATTEQVLLETARSTNRSLNVCIFRLGGIYGPGRTLQRIYRRIVGTTQPGDGRQFSNWIHLDDIVGAIDFARQQKLQGIYNLVDGCPVLRRDLLAWLCDRHQLSPVSWDASQPNRRPYHIRVSNHKLKQAGYSLKQPDVFSSADA